MIRKACLIAASVMLMVLPAVLAAGAFTPPGKWWELPDLSEDLGLSRADKDALDRLYVQSRRNLIDKKTGVERERFELDTVLSRPELDEKAALDRFKRLEQQRQNLALERFRYLLEVRKILGYDRYVKLTTKAREFHRKRAGHREEDLSTR